MRLSTSSMYGMGLSAMLKQQSDFTNVAQQLATGKRVVSPSDDPRAASQALVVSQSIAVNEQYSASRTTAKQNLELEEGVLQNVTDALQSLSPLIVQAGNGTLSDADRNSLATQIDGLYQQMLGLANSQDGNGNYIFAGVKGDTQPFVAGDDGSVSYQGATLQMEQKVDASRSMTSGDLGSTVFTQVASSASYIGKGSSDNQGTVVFSGPSVSDTKNEDYGKAFNIVFGADTDGNTTYTVSYEGGGTVDGMADLPYTSGQTISFGGLSMTFSGEPETDDKFSVARGSAADSNILNAMADLVTALKQPLDSENAKANYENAIATASRQTSNALDNVLTVRASIGSKLNELDALDVTGDSRVLNYKSTLSDLEDLDYASAISDYMLKQTSLQAAQKTFTQIQGMSLFDLL